MLQLKALLLSPAWVPSVPTTHEASGAVKLPHVELMRRSATLATPVPESTLLRESVAVPPNAVGPHGPDIDLEVTRGRALIDAAAEAGVDQVVLTTVASMSTTGQSSASKALVEQYLHDHVARPTVLRPVRFMTNYIGNLPFGIDGIVDGVHRHLFSPDEPMQIIALEDIAEFAALAFADPTRFAGRTLELAGDQPTPVEAAAAISEATGLPVRYEQLTDDQIAALHPVVAATKAQWQAGHRWHADIEALRVIHPGLRTLADWLTESGAAAIRDRRHTAA